MHEKTVRNDSEASPSAKYATALQDLRQTSQPAVGSGLGVSSA